MIPNKIFFTCETIDEPLMNFALFLGEHAYSEGVIIHVVAPDSIRIYSSGFGISRPQAREIANATRRYNRETLRILSLERVHDAIPARFERLQNDLLEEIRARSIQAREHNGDRVTATEVIVRNALSTRISIHFICNNYVPESRTYHPTEEGYLREYQSRPRAMRFRSSEQIQQIPRTEMIQAGRVNTFEPAPQYPVYIDEYEDLLTEPTRQTTSNINQGDHMSDTSTVVWPVPNQPIQGWTEISADRQVAAEPQPVATLQDLTKTLADFASYPTPVILLAELLEQKHITPKSNETDTNFLNEQQQCLEVIMQLTEAIGHQNFMINQFIQPVSKSKSRRLVSSTGAIGAIINAYIHEQEKIKVLEKLNAAKENAASTISTILKSRNVSIPVISPVTNLASQIIDLEHRIINNTEKLSVAQDKVSSLVVQNNNYAKELKDMKAYLRSIGKVEEANQMDDVFAFLETLDGKSFPYEYLGVLPKGSNNHDEPIHFIFKRPEQTIFDRDSDLEWIVPEMYVRMRLYLDGITWRYDFKAMFNKFFPMLDIFKTGDSAYLRYNSNLSHPHVNNSDNICRGNAAAMLDNMCTDLTKIEDSLLVLDSLFRTYNPGSPYQSTVNFLKYGPQFLSKLANLSTLNQGTFTQGLKDQVISGQMSLTELSDALLDKFHEVIRHRFMCHLGDYGLSWDSLVEGVSWPVVSSLQDYHGSTSENFSWRSELSMYRPFDSSSRSLQFMDHIYPLIDIGGFVKKFDDFYSRFYNGINSDGNTEVRSDIIEALAVFMEDTKQSYRNLVENRIKNYENVLTKGYEIAFQPADYKVNNQNFDVWFTQTRKK